MADSPKEGEAAQALFCSIADFLGSAKVQKEFDLNKLPTYQAFKKHYGKIIDDCYAKTDISGNRIEYEESSGGWGGSVHEKNTNNYYVKQPSSAKGGTCYRCGRTSHYSPDCYARTHHTGYALDSDDDSDDELDDDDRDDDDDL